jgi:hypothetical protein
VLLGKAQTNLPVSRTTWNSETPLGWTDWGTVIDSSSYNCSENTGKFESSGDYYEIFFVGIPNQLSFQINGDSFEGGNFSLQESSDGVYWSNLKVYKSIEINCETQNFKLKNTTRFVRFYFIRKEKGNISIDNVEITADIKAKQENNITENNVIKPSNQNTTLVDN